jgi:hypothetical protein
VGPTGSRVALPVQGRCRNWLCSDVRTALTACEKATVAEREGDSTAG